MEAPLQGLRVVELARILAGPWIGQTLADLGADVIKVESPEGDDTRSWGPPFVKNADGSDADAAYFHCCNRGKRSVIADFNSADDLDFVCRLIRQADVVIENFKCDGLRKYGLDYGACAATNARLVYCSVTGFGQTGPYASRAGYDAMIQGMGGIMDLTGDPGGEPQKIGVAFADIFTGVYGVVAIQAALAQRERSGLGQHIDMALLDVMVSVLALASVAADPRYATNAGRVRDRESLVAALSAALLERHRDELLRQFEAAGVPAGPINTLRDVFADPQVQARGLRVDLAARGYHAGSIPSVRTPIQFSDSSLAIDAPSPRLGEHTGAVRRQLSLDATEWPPAAT